MDESAPITQKTLNESLSRAFSKFGPELRKDIKEDIKKSADDILGVLQGFIGDVDERFGLVEKRLDRIERKFDRQNEKNDARFNAAEVDVKLLKIVTAK